MALTWKELQEEARAIMAKAEPKGPYEDHAFTCGSGGSPVNNIGLPEKHRSDTARYQTVRNGTAYRGEVVIACRATGTRDAAARDIWQCTDGSLFVYVYTPGAPEYFDEGYLHALNCPRAEGAPARGRKAQGRAQARP